MNQGVKNFPLAIKVTKWTDQDDENALPCSKPLMSNLATKLEWQALRETVASVSLLSHEIQQDTPTRPKYT